MKRKAVFIFLMTIVLGSLLFSNVNRKKLLLNRANEYWRARTKDDLVTVYNMLSKESKKNVTLTSFIRKTNIKVTEYEISSVNINKVKPSRGVVKVIFSGYAMGYPLKKIRNKQLWIFEDGNWYVDYKVSETKKGFVSKNKLNSKLDPRVKEKLMKFIKEHNIVPPKVVSPEKLKNEKKNNIK